MNIIVELKKKVLKTENSEKFVDEQKKQLKGRLIKPLFLRYQRQYSESSQ